VKIEKLNFIYYSAFPKWVAEYVKQNSLSGVNYLGRWRNKKLKYFGQPVFGANRKKGRHLHFTFLNI